jgi:glycosyltransferase involved in cell wall biosynthesis
VVEEECDRLGIELPPGSEHAFQADVLEREEQEYHRADKLLCPSDFVASTFLNEGFPKSSLARHRYGYDPAVFYVDPSKRKGRFTMLFAGVCAVRKGLHFALEAWLSSPACDDGSFLIAGDFLPDYRRKLDGLLQHHSVKLLGHRKDLPQLMRSSDILILPSVEEGSALVTAEARGSGCVLLVSEAAGAVCQHLENALVHRTGDVATLSEHITMLYRDRSLLEQLRESSLSSLGEITWDAAGAALLSIYRDVVSGKKSMGATAANN